MRAMIALAAVASLAASPALAAPALAVTHALIMVSPGAPERARLEEAGFVIAPQVNRHEGQGTASATVELLNGFLELMWREPTVSVAPGREAAAEGFARRADWRSTGYAPIGVGFAWRGPPQPLPFATWKVSEAWMAPGAAIEIFTPRELPKAVRLFTDPNPAADEAANRALAADPAMGAMFRHPNGARRLTAVKVITPPDGLPPAGAYVDAHSDVRLTAGQGWLLDLTFDEGVQGKTRDLRPQLPLIIRY